jgi:capsular polysaccharide transport system permease protein
MSDRSITQQFTTPDKKDDGSSSSAKIDPPASSRSTEKNATRENAELLPSDHDDTLRGRIILLLRAIGKHGSEAVSPCKIFPQSSGPLAPAAIPPGAPPPKQNFFKRHWLFLATVVIPSMLALIYFGLMASNVYVSETRFVVRTPNKQTTGGLTGILQGAGFSGIGRAPEDVYTVSQYTVSRDALNHLDDTLDLRATWGSPEVDIMRRFNPLGWDDSREALYEYYPRRVSVGIEPGSGITTLNASAFNPDQAHRINEILLGEAEKLVNKLNDRARNDLIRFAENEVKIAEDKAKAAAAAVSAYRNTEGVVDPEKQTELHFQQIARLQEELVRTEAQLTQLRVFAPDSPHPPALELRAQTLQNEIAKEMEKITGGENSLASKAAEYERLALEREFADKQLAGALAALELARNEAQRQQLYLETIAKPSLPDGPMYPRRLRGVLTTLILGLVAWGILSMLMAGVREHQY